MVDCSDNYGNDGCDGGEYTYAWNYLRTRGQELAENYRYTGKDGYCNYEESLGLVQTTSGGHAIAGYRMTSM